MNLLIVDDEPDVIDGILDGVDFAAIGITQIFTVFSANEARRILISEEINIMLTDIEMPGENGLELLSWVRARNFPLVTLFCTSFANFDYAKKAVEMHSFDYYLKPISYPELQNRLQTAVQEAIKNQNLLRYQKQDELWLDFQKEHKRIFWANVLFSSLPLIDIIKEAKDSGLSYDENDCCFVAVLVLSYDTARITEWQIYGFRNISEELFSQENVTPDSIIPLEDHKWLIICTEPDISLLDEILREHIYYVNKYLELNLTCYKFSGCTVAETRNYYNWTEAVLKDNVMDQNCLLDVKKYNIQDSYYNLDVTTIGWLEMFDHGQENDLIRDIEIYIDKMASLRRVNYQFLKTLRFDLIQMIYSGLYKRNIVAHKLYLTDEYESLYTKSLYTISYFKSYMQYLIHHALAHIRFIKESQTVIGRVKDYMDAHLSNEINRTTLAQQVYLNPDYLARLFKKETGCSIGAYLLDKRIEEAKRLLTETSTQVNEIAMLVGYDNFSYFSHIFKDRVGMSPVEYRKLHNT